MKLRPIKKNGHSAIPAAMLLWEEGFSDRVMCLSSPDIFWQEEALVNTDLAIILVLLIFLVYGVFQLKRMSGFEMIGLVEELVHRGLWIILIFHEIDGERLTVGSYDFKMLLNYLHRKKDLIWTAPVLEVAKKIVSNRS
jgi:hypothetical protein